MMLDMVAVSHGWKRPRTTMLKPGCLIPRDTVLKRSHSDGGYHVIFPEQSVKGNGRTEMEARQDLNDLRDWSILNARTSSPEQRWVSQEYVDTLITCGEWRCFVVGGRIVSVLHTVKTPEDNIWHGQRVWQFLTLKEIRCVKLVSENYDR